MAPPVPRRLPTAVLSVAPVRAPDTADSEHQAEFKR